MLPSKIMQYLKVKTSRKLMMKYIKLQDGNEPSDGGDDFRLSPPRLKGIAL
jgi:hypothetical protein